MFFFHFKLPKMSIDDFILCLAFRLLTEKMWWFRYFAKNLIWFKLFEMFNHCTLLPVWHTRNEKESIVHFSLKLWHKECKWFLDKNLCAKTRPRSCTQWLNMPQKSIKKHFQFLKIPCYHAFKLANIEFLKGYLEIALLSTGWSHSAVVCCLMYSYVPKSIRSILRFKAISIICLSMSSEHSGGKKTLMTWKIQNNFILQVKPL